MEKGKCSLQLFAAQVWKKLGSVPARQRRMELLARRKTVRKELLARRMAERKGLLRRTVKWGFQEEQTSCLSDIFHYSEWRWSLI